MNKQTKMILTVIGLGAIIVPAILLIVASSGSRESPDPASGNRTIDAQNIEETVNRIPRKPAEVYSPPPPSTPSAIPSPEISEEGSPSSEI